jgi:uncharacterized protein DUF4019
MIRLIQKSTMVKAALTFAVATGCTLAVAEPGTSADELLGDATQVLQQIDADHYDAVWQNAAPFIHEKMSQDQFVDHIRVGRHSFGAVSNRGWASVTRIRYTKVSGIPDGLYANVDFSTTLTDGRTLFEMLSFQLESDGQWRLTGYVPRQSQNVAAGSAQIVAP